MCMILRPFAHNFAQLHGAGRLPVGARFDMDHLLSHAFDELRYRRILVVYPINVNNAKSA